MVVSVILHRLKAALLFIVSLIKRSLCCLRRRRRSSVDSIPLTGIGIVPSYDPASNQELEGWISWEDDRPPQTVQEHIEHYRRQGRNKSSESPPQLQENFFHDMEPEIIKQKKMLLRAKENEGDMASRLAFVPDSFVPNEEGELGSWEETEERSESWAEAEGWDAEGILREKRREEHKKRILEKDHRRAVLGSRVS